MRAIVVLLCLASAVANAQPPEAPTAPADPPLTPPPMTSAPREERPKSKAPSHPEDEFVTPSFTPAPAAPPPAAPPPAAPSPPAWTPPAARSTGPAESPAERAVRYSRFSAGSGGPALVVTEVLLGLTGGAFLGSTYDAEGKTSNLYTGAMLGGLTLGTGSILYQYFQRVERDESLLATLTSLSGLAGGIGFANAHHFGDRDRIILSLATSQVGLFAALLLSAGGLDISSADVGLMSITSFYSVLIASLIEFINDARNSTRGYNFAPMLMAPAIGMAIGGLLSIPLEMNGVAFALVTTVPLVASGFAIALAAPLSNNATTGKAVLITLTSSLGVTALITALTAEPPKQRASAGAPRLTPTPVVLAAGRRNTGLAVGPGVAIQF
jgi:hypothetical protein